jgi:hypothetical protein
MANCPYPTHQGMGPAIADELPISFCKENCSRTFFRCPRCGEANRPLARFCRRCSDAISFERVELDYDAPFSNDGVEIGRCKLSALGVKDVYSLSCFMGHLVVDCDASVIVLDIHKPYEAPLLVFSSPDGRAVRGSTLFPLHDEHLLLITTANGIYEVDLLDLSTRGEPLYNTRPEPLYKTKGNNSFLYHRAFSCAGQIYVLEHDRSSATSRLVRLPDRVVATFPKFSNSPLVLTDDRIFLAANDRVLLYETNDESLLEEQLPEPLIEGAQPAYIEELNLVYVVGQTNFWRGEATKTNFSFSPLNVKATGDPHIAAKGTELFVAHSRGIFIMDPFGSIKWDSQHNFISAISDGRAPQIFKNHFAFTSPGPIGGSSIRLHSLSNPKEFDLVSFNKRLLCAPLLSLGHLCVAIGDEELFEVIVK